MKTLLALVAAAILVAAPVAAQDVAERAAVNGAYIEQNAAVHAKDIVRFMNTFAPDFQGKTLQGVTVSRDKMRQNVLKMFKNTTSATGVSTIQKFAIKSGKAYVTVKEHDTVEFIDLQTKEKMTIVIDEINSMVLRKIGGVWKQESSRGLAEKSTLLPVK